MTEITFRATVPLEKYQEAFRDFERVKMFWSEYSSGQEETRKAIEKLQLIRAECLAQMNHRNLVAVCMELRRFEAKWEAQPADSVSTEPTSETEVRFCLY